MTTSSALGSPLAPRSYTFSTWYLLHGTALLLAFIRQLYAWSLRGLRQVMNLGQIYICIETIKWLSKPYPSVTNTDSKSGDNEPTFGPNKMLNNGLISLYMPILRYFVNSK